MKAILEFDLPEDSNDHEYAVKGIEMRILISDLENEIRQKLKYDGGEFAGQWHFEEYKENESGEYVPERVAKTACDHTLEKVRDWLTKEMIERNIPELI